jgi:hypothetical protein
MSDFERSLKDHADQFKMIPSKRVWNGIYNNLHPGSKWPSISVAIIFLFTLVTIGRLNNSTGHLTKFDKTDFNKEKTISKVKNEIASAKPLSDQSKSQLGSQKNDTKDDNNPAVENNNNYQAKIIAINNTSVSASTVSFSNKKIHSGIEQRTAKNVSLNSSLLDDGFENSPKKVPDQSLYSLQKNIQPISAFGVPQDQYEGFNTTLATHRSGIINDLIIPVSFPLATFPSSESLSLNAEAFSYQIADADKNIFTQNNSLNAHKNLKKKKNKVEWTFYVSPVISTVSFSKKTVKQQANNSMVVLANQSSFKLLRTARIGMEAGTEMSFKIDKKFKFVTGFNLSYSGYNNLSNLVHPTYASLTLSDGNGATYSKNYITHYGNGQAAGHVSLVNYNIQASIPLGVKFNIWGNEKIKIDFASLIEPSVLLKNDAYMISSDGRYYVNDPLLVRRTNLDGHLGSYITIIGKKIKWHLGPDFRYQLFSTYKSIYPSREHLIDYGIRIGISK